MTDRMEIETSEFHHDTSVVNRDDLMRLGEFAYSGDARDLNWERGEWPKSISVDGLKFTKQEPLMFYDECVGYKYVCHNIVIDITR